MNSTRQINIWTLGGLDNSLSPLEGINIAKDCGYNGLELVYGSGRTPIDVTEKEVLGWREAAEKAGIKLESVCSGNYWETSLGHPDPAQRARAVEYTRKYLRFAGWLGAGVALVIPGWVAVPWDHKQPVVDYDEAWRLSSASIWKCVTAAEQANVVMGVENVWNWFLSDPYAMREYVDQFRHPMVGAYVDVANCLINGFPEQWLRMLGHRVAGVHFKNFTRADCAGGLKGFGEDLDDGDVDWPAVRQAMIDIGYTGPVTAELVPFSRLPGPVVPDIELARRNAPMMEAILAGTLAKRPSGKQEGPGRLF